jgi:urease accessory protein UreH
MRHWECCACLLTFAGGSVLGDAVTAEFKINYLIRDRR